MKIWLLDVWENLLVCTTVRGINQNFTWLHKSTSTKIKSCTDCNFKQIDNILCLRLEHGVKGWTIWLDRTKRNKIEKNYFSFSLTIISDYLKNKHLFKLLK